MGGSGEVEESRFGSLTAGNVHCHIASRALLSLFVDFEDCNIERWSFARLVVQGLFFGMLN